MKSHEAITTSNNENELNKTITEENNIQIHTNSNFIPCEDLSLLNVSKNSKFKKPTIVQKYVIPIILKKKSFYASAPTGSGKTLSFLFPLIENTSYNIRGITTCIITPTRELAIQIYHEAEKLVDKKLRRLTGICYGKSQMDDRIDDCNILVATPGKLYDYLKSKKLTLDKVEYLILDEADALLDMGFYNEIRHIKSYINKSAKIGLFSATYPPGFDGILEEIMPNDYFYVKVENKNSNTHIKQTILMDNNKKDEEIKKILLNLNFKENWRSKTSGDKVIIFVEHKTDADELQRKISQMKIRCEAIHGNKLQSRREMILESFRKGLMPVLIATSLASRGIDVEDLTHVINYDFPSNLIEYMHRIGRTGRAGKPGESISFINIKKISRDEKLELIRILEKSKNIVPSFLRKFPLENHKYHNFSTKNYDANKNSSQFNKKNQKSTIKKIKDLQIVDKKNQETSINPLLSEKVDSEDEVCGGW